MRTGKDESRKSRKNNLAPVGPLQRPPGLVGLNLEKQASSETHGHRGETGPRSSAGSLAPLSPRAHTTHLGIVLGDLVNESLLCDSMLLGLARGRIEFLVVRSGPDRELTLMLDGRMGVGSRGRLASGGRDADIALLLVVVVHLGQGDVREIEEREGTGMIR